MNSRRIVAVGLLGGALGMAHAALAAPITYTYTGGDVVITNVTVDGVQALADPSPAPEFALGSGSTATIDTSADTLSFAFAQSSSPFIVDLTGGASGFNLNSATFTLTNVALDSPSMLTLTPQGSNGYTFVSASGITVGGTYNLAGVVTSSGTFNSGNVNFGPNNQPFSGSATVLTSSDTLEIDGLSLATFTIKGQTVDVTGNVIFDGSPVPLPAAVWLLGSGLGLLGLLRRRPT